MTTDNVALLEGLLDWPTGKLATGQKSTARQKWNMLDQLLKFMIRVQRAALASSQWPVGLSGLFGLSGFFA